MKFRTGFLRGGGALAALVLFFAVGARAETTNTLSDAEIQGRQLAQQLCDSKPQTNANLSGLLVIVDQKGKKNIHISSQITVHEDSWQVDYLALQTNYLGNPSEQLVTHFFVYHRSDSLNVYELVQHEDRMENIPSQFIPARHLHEKQIMAPFANSDFWLCDLGLEFFHWPAQKILPKPTNLVRGREYTLLESTNPSTNGYSRVLTWIDKETGGPLQAEAYDLNGKLLKEFQPKSFKKVNGQWELQEMEIRNVQTGSRTRLEFDLNKQ
jgi:hypothetical protein